MAVAFLGVIWAMRGKSLLIFVSLGLACLASANFRYPTFNQTTGVSLSGDAFRIGGAVRLAYQNHWGGSMNYGKKIDLASGFESRFRIRISNPGGLGGGADGFAFLIHGSGTKAIGWGGEYLGYDGIKKGLAIEFDLYKNDYDPDNHHASIHHSNGGALSSDESQSVARNSGIPFLADGKVHEVYVRYKGGLLAASLDGVEVVKTSVSLGAITGTPLFPSAYFGISASTGNGYANFDILSWELSTGARLDSRAVLLVHGINSDSDVWSVATKALKAEGFTVEAVNFKTEPETLSNQASVLDQAKALSRRIRELRQRSDQTSVNIIAHSMGGLATRLYLATPSIWMDKKGLDPGVSKVIMLGTPNLGSDAMMVNPIISTIGARLSDDSSTYQFNAVTPGFRDLFGAWMPPPAGNDYPAGFKLAKWPALKSPMSDYTYAIADAALRLKATGENDKAIRAATTAMPKENRDSPHKKVFLSQLKILGQKLLPESGSIEGVDCRRVSNLIYQLSSQPDRGLASYYLIAGNDNTVQMPNLIPNMKPGPYTIPSDGIVPVDSVFGIDPITKARLLDYKEAQQFHTNHTAMPKAGTVIAKAIQWLKQYP